MTTKLRLNWKLEWRDERIDFLNTYINSLTWTPTEDDLEMMGKYILWGRDRQTGKNGRQEGLQLETAHKTWDSKPIESLDALIETPGFNELSLRSASTPPLTKKLNFSRSEARALASPHLKAELESLWSSIDKLDLITSLYALSHSLRTAPIRDSLLSSFSPSELASLKETASHLTIYQYLKERHKLVEMRRQQYTLRDSYAPVMFSQTTHELQPLESPTFGNEIEVFPFGVVFNEDLLSHKIFNETRFPKPDDFTEDELKLISNQIWTQKSRPRPRFYFDFSNPEHLYALFNNWSELCAQAEDLGDSISEDTNIREFLRAARTYRQLAKLDPLHDDILEMKIQKKTNQEIQEVINKKYGKKYKVNYISTLYCKKCLEDIAQAARDHFEVLENLFFAENFKKCKDCGEVLLLSEKNFVKRARSNDGFSPRCKKCEKILRDRRKGK